jgi:MFS family permease
MRFNSGMTSTSSPREPERGIHPGRQAILICAAVLAALAVAMGIGRFAFTPLFPLMVRDGLLGGGAGAVLAASNYLGYLVGALAATRLRVASARLLAFGLGATVLTTAAMGWTATVPAWTMLRFLAGVASAWTLVATSAWGLAWLAALGRARLAGLAFSGVGVGIASAGLFCLVAGGTLSSSAMWTGLAGLALLGAVLPLAASRRWPVPSAAAAATPAPVATQAASPGRTGGLVVCYTLYGFGYILPATYLPALARQLVDDPQVFGLAWPLFGAAGAVSTALMSGPLGRANRLLVGAVCHAVMAAGVLLPALWTSLSSVVVAALLVGGTFMVITLVAMQEGRARAEARATQVLGQMTAGFALGQLVGPLVNAGIGRLVANEAGALHIALALSAAGLLSSAIYLWREYRREPRHDTYKEKP